MSYNNALVIYSGDVIRLKEWIEEKERQDRQKVEKAERSHIQYLRLRLRHARKQGLI